MFTMEVIDNLRDIFASVCTNPEAELMEFDREHDHVSSPSELSAKTGGISAGK